MMTIMLDTCCEMRMHSAHLPSTSFHSWYDNIRVLPAAGTETEGGQDSVRFDGSTQSNTAVDEWNVVTSAPDSSSFDDPCCWTPLDRLRNSCASGRRGLSQAWCENTREF